MNASDFKVGDRIEMRNPNFPDKRPSRHVVTKHVPGAGENGNEVMLELDHSMGAPAEWCSKARIVYPSTDARDAGARHHLAYTDAAKAIGDTELSAANMCVYVNAAIDAGLVSLSVVRGSRDHDPRESAGAIPDFDGEAAQEPSCLMCYGRRVVETMGPAPDDGLDVVMGSATCPHCAPETKSLDAAHLAPSAAQAELGATTTRPDEGAGPSESVRHAARRESRDAGLDLDAIMARFNATTQGEWFVRGADEYGSFVTDGVIFVRNEDGEIDLYKSSADASQEDDEFIVAARSDIPALVAECRRLRAALSALPTRIECQGCGTWFDFGECPKCDGTGIARELRAACQRNTEGDER